MGSIQLTGGRGQGEGKARAIAKGEELGYFAFGGSTIVCLFHHGGKASSSSSAPGPGEGGASRGIVFDEDLLRRSRRGVETLVRMGESLGRSYYTKPSSMAASNHSSSGEGGDTSSGGGGDTKTRRRRLSKGRRQKGK